MTDLTANIETAIAELPYGLDLSFLNGVERLAISFSGGETSALMTALLLQICKDRCKTSVVFANTGLENEETLEFVDECDRKLGFNSVWVEAVFHSEFNKGTTHKVVDFASATRGPQLFEGLCRKYGTPAVNFPHCTRELKRRPFRSHLKGYWVQYATAIGIRADEFDRINPEKAAKERLIYPLAEWGIQKTDVNRFWSQMPFRLRLAGWQGNCRTCWKKSDRKLGTIALYHPEWFDDFRQLEKEFENHRPETQPNRTLPARFFRGHRTVDEIMQIPNQPGFVPADDDSLNTVTITQQGLFDYTADIDGGCSESCEAF